MILNAALDLLAERGYEKTTMRAIAEKAGVSLGNAYHYFKSKEHLIQAFYQRTHDEHLAASLPVLDKERGLKGRLLAVMRLKIATLEPYHEFAAVLFKTAADPHSPLNPFGQDAAPVRSDTIQLFESLVADSKTRLPADLRAELPYLLLRLVRFGLGGHAGNGKQYVSWIHDRDFVRAVMWLFEHEELEGPVNLASPNPLTNAEFMRVLRLSWGVSFGLPAAEWMLEVGAVVLRTETELILKSRRVVPTKLLQSGFAFQFPNWPEAAKELCSRIRNNGHLP